MVGRYTLRRHAMINHLLGLVKLLKGISLCKPPFEVRSCEVAIIWPDLMTLNSSPLISFEHANFTALQIWGIWGIQTSNPPKYFVIIFLDIWPTMHTGAYWCRIYIWMSFKFITQRLFEEITNSNYSSSDLEPSTKTQVSNSSKNNLWDKSTPKLWKKSSKWSSTFTMPLANHFDVFPKWWCTPLPHPAGLCRQPHVLHSHVPIVPSQGPWPVVVSCKQRKMYVVVARKRCM